MAISLIRRRRGDIASLFRLLILAKASFFQNFAALHRTHRCFACGKTRRSSDLRLISPNKIGVFRPLFYLAEEGRFELPLQVSPH